VQRLAPEKGTMRALEALAMVSRKAGEQISIGGRRAHLVIAGDGPSRRALEQYAAAHSLPVTFVGNLPNNELPTLYRAADVFVTCSTSETYGLTVLEALSCGTPVVVPHCDVFDELWQERVPKEWMYDETVDGSLLASLQVAGRVEAKAYLSAHPIKGSWRDATVELLEQYKHAIEANLPNRTSLAKFTVALDHLLRAIFVAFLCYVCMKWYTKRVLKASLKAGRWGVGLLDDMIEFFEF